MKKLITALTILMSLQVLANSEIDCIKIVDQLDAQDVTCTLEKKVMIDAYEIYQMNQTQSNYEKLVNAQNQASLCSKKAFDICMSAN